jgi:hypothetical protein
MYNFYHTTSRENGKKKKKNYMGRKRKLMVILIFIGYEEDIGGILALGVRYIFMF